MLEAHARILLPAPGPEYAAPAAPPAPHAIANGPCDRWLGPGELSHWSAPVAAPVPCRVSRQSILLHEGARAHTFYIVQAGDFKVSRTAEDGYEQVIAFAGAGDALGLDGLASGCHLGTVEALQDAIVYAVPLADLRALRAANPAFDLCLMESLGAHWACMRDMAWLMGAMGADRRTARFLLQLSGTMARRGMSPRRLRLAMSRRDIAAHLGLAHESISRAMTSLAMSGYLRVYGREVEILDMEGLEQLAANTRGHASESLAAPVRQRMAGRTAAPERACPVH
ncbi:MAG TPA: helix-turn-helix domain-containing protein [Burkholderiaceae bacterium]